MQIWLDTKKENDKHPAVWSQNVKHEAALKDIMDVMFWPTKSVSGKEMYPFDLACAKEYVDKIEPLLIRFPFNPVILDKSRQFVPNAL